MKTGRRLTPTPSTRDAGAVKFDIANAVMSGDLASLDIDMPVRGNRQMVLDHTDALARALELVMDPDNWPIMINCTAGTVLRFVPPLVVTEKEIDRAFAILDEALAEE